MFVFSSIVVKLNIAPAKAPFIFALFGIATQFFDFYTTPLITYAIPVLLLLLCKEYSSCRWLTLIKTAAAWAYGYVSMWIVKLAATTLFTDTNGFADGFSSLSRRLNISSAQSSIQQPSYM